MELLDALLVLREQAVAGDIDSPEYGICFNLYELTGEGSLSYDFVGDNCEDWEHFSGEIDYPIKDYCAGNLWEGEQLELRLSLLNHLITKAKSLDLS